MKEKIHRNRDLRAWTGEIPTWHRYTYGIAGERFFREIKENARLVASQCPRCGTRHIPPKLYCPDCMVETSEYVPVPETGVVETFTVLHRDLEDRPLSEPQIVAFIAFPGFSGGLIHLLGEVDPEEVEVGMEVQPVWEEKRTGTLKDIRYFRPL